MLTCLVLSTGCFAATDQAPEPERHRPESAPVCDSTRPDFPITPDPSAFCMSHDSCTEGTNGRCTDFGRGYVACSYDECFSDADCAAGPCACDDTASAHHCLGGNCQVDADCGPGGYCSPSFSDCGDYTGVVAYYCHTPDDECVDDSDCGGTGPFGAYCMHSVELGRWICNDTHCVG